jgi:ubiquinone/menaquinone biosynthesis C-methylase UbiE
MQFSDIARLLGRSKRTHEGHLDGMNGDVVYGWALSLADPAEEVKVKFYRNGNLIGEAVAREYRQDLHKARVGLGHGNYGFSFQVPAQIRALRNYTLSAFAGGDTELAGSPLEINEAPELPFRRRGTHVRDFLAQQFLRGRGIEIGALNLPCKVPEGTVVTNVDSKSTEELLEYYRTEMHGHTVVKVDIVTDAHTLAGIEASSQDFVIANQVLEHLENPLLALENMLRVVKPGGVVFLSLPDKRYTFDVDRPVTPFAHILQDYRLGPEQTREAHYREWIELVDKSPAAEVPERLNVMMNVLRYPIHFHVWTQFEMFEMFDEARVILPFPYEIDCFKANDFEALFVLRKLA